MRSCGDGWLEKNASTLVGLRPASFFRISNISTMPRPSHPARRHQRQPDPIGLALLVAAELQEDAAGEELRRHLRAACAAAVAQQRAQEAETPLRHRRRRQLRAA